MNKKDPETETWKPIFPNPFIVGNPVRDARMFYGRESEFELVRRRFTEASAEGGILVFCGERRSGKTSILFQILNGRLGPAFIPVLIDMQSMAIQSEEEFLLRISEEIAVQMADGGTPVQLPDFSSGSKASSIFHRFVSQVLRKHPDRKLILLFDEYELLENKIDSGVLSEDALHILASLMESDAVFLVFTGSLGLEKRRRDYWRILGKSLFRRVSYLEEPDAVRLITEPVKGKVEYDPEVVEAIYRLTSGQPFYTQAVCQNLVDTLNEDRTKRASADLVTRVVEGVVRNPFPQMIFLWEGLEPEEKIALALLAETLADESDHAGAAELLKTRDRARYPLKIDPGTLASALESLFKRELLYKDNSDPPGYAFRMDLWRHWVRRMHSVWQVMQELGLETRVASRGRRYVTMGLGVAAVVATIGLLLVRPWADRRSVSPVAAEQAFVHIETEPRTATISRNGQVMGQGILHSPIPVEPAEFRIFAPGYADSVFVPVIAANDTVRGLVRLAPLRGNVHIVTEPPGASIRIDDETLGKSPLTASGLVVLGTHEVEARLDPYEPVRRTFRVEPDSTLELPVIALTRRTVPYTVTTAPPGADLTVNGVPQGPSPLTADLPVGKHRIQAVLEGFAPADTTVLVGEGSPALLLRLALLPPGLLQVLGDSVGVIYVDDEKVREHTYNSGWLEVPPGSHSIQVKLLSGTLVSTTVEVGSATRVQYNYTTRAVTVVDRGSR